MTHGGAGFRCSLLLTIVSATALAQPGAPARADGSNTGNVAYTLWFLHHADYDEFSAGQLALANAGSEQVKAFGKTLLTDQQATGQTILAAARKLKVDLEPHLTGGDKVRMERIKAKMEKLKSLKGRAFDALFTTLMAQEHHQVIELVTEALQDPKQESIKPVLLELLPRMQAHAKTAESLVKEMATAQ